MKKILLLLTVILCSYSSYAQTLSGTPTPVASGGEVTFTASGESQIDYILAVTSYTISPAFNPDVEVLDVANSYQSYDFSAGKVTSFKLKFINSSSSDKQLIISFYSTIQHNGSQTTNALSTVTITVKAPVAAVYKNVAKSGVFRKACGTGFEGTQVTYTIAANTYSASTQAAADQLAIDAVNAGGQAYANANGQCKTIYYSVEQQGMFTRNNCLTDGTPGAAVPYTKAAGAYTSIISQQDANSKAAAALIVDGQVYANLNGTCIYPAYISGQQQVLKNMSHDYTVHNSLPGDVFSWEILDINGFPTDIATVLQGQGTGVLRIKLTNAVFDYYPIDFQIVLTITNANSSPKTVYYDVQLVDQIRP